MAFLPFRLTSRRRASGPPLSGLDRPELEHCLGGEVAGRVQANIDEGKGLKVAGTPTIFIGTVRDRRLYARERIAGAAPVSEIMAALDRAIAAR